MNGIDIHGGWALIFAAVTIILSFFLGKMNGFLSYTSLHSLYSSRLIRAYLGAYNPQRWRPESCGVTEPMPQDDVYMPEYTPHTFGGPLHIINATLNETSSGQSQIEQRDRKGSPVAVSALAMSVGVSHHAEVSVNKDLLTVNVTALAPPKDGTYRIFEGTMPIQAELLSLGEWVGISGAAVSTGMGSRTSLGLSMILAFFNIRLGYWWDSGINPAARICRHRHGCLGNLAEGSGALFSKVFSVQSYLVDEFLGRFHGPARKLWYLTDGGHYENTGVYELMRRQLPLIICIDNGADPEYTFTDLGNLVRRVRTDFGAEIRFLPADKRNRVLNALDDGDEHGQINKLRATIQKEIREGACCQDSEKNCLVEDFLAKEKCHLHIGHIQYDLENRTGLLLWIKPIITGDEDFDIIEYQKCHTDFPQESTADQFFDEAQWESYRRLGEHSGNRLGDILRKLLPRYSPGALKNA